MDAYLIELRDRGKTMTWLCNTPSHPRTPSIWSLRALRSSARVRCSALRWGRCSARTSAPECSSEASCAPEDQYLGAALHGKQQFLREILRRRCRRRTSRSCDARTKLSTDGESSPGASPVPKVPPLLHPDVEFHTHASAPEAGVYRGREAVIEYHERVFGQFESIRIELEELLPVGESVVIVTRQHTVPRGSEAEIVQDVVDDLDDPGRAACRAKALLDPGRRPRSRPAVGSRPGPLLDEKQHSQIARR